MGHDNDDFSEPEITREVGHEIEIAAARLGEAKKRGRLATRETFNWAQIRLLGECYTDGRYDDEKVRPLIRLARHNDPDALVAISWIVCNLSTRNIPLPPNLCRFITATFRKKKSETKGVKRQVVRQRDWYIASAVAAVSKRYPRFRDPKHKNGRPKASACWIVKMALARIGIHMTEKKVEHAYTKGRQFQEQKGGQSKIVLPFTAVALLRAPKNDGSYF